MVTLSLLQVPYSLSIRVIEPSNSVSVVSTFLEDNYHKREFDQLEVQKPKENWPHPERSTLRSGNSLKTFFSIQNYKISQRLVAIWPKYKNST